MERTSKIYIAGHKGLVGSAIKRRLEGDGYTNLIYKTSKELDLRRQTDVEEFFKKERPEYVFLSAARVGGILANSIYKAKFIYDNIMIAVNVIHSAYEYRVKKLLNLGSSCIYPKLSPQPMKEEYLLTGALESTNEPYAIAKISAIKLCRYYNEQYGADFISVMPTNLYGPYDNFNLKTSHVLPALIRKFHLAKLLRDGKINEITKDIKRFPVGFDFDLDISLDLRQVLEKLGILPGYIKLWGSGEPYREFLFVEDLADACLFLMKNYHSEDVGELINIGTGTDLKIKELAKLIRKVTGFEGEVEWDTSKPDGTPRKLLHTLRMKALGWQPKISLETGLKKTYRWYLEVVSNYSA